MSEHDLEKLLGGYATNQLTEAERKALFEAALHDQLLFDALADEQALKELLGDPAAHRRIFAALEEATVAVSVAAAAPLASNPLAWSAFEWFRRPAHVALAGSLAAGLFAVMLGTRIYQDSFKQVAEPAATEDNNVASPPQPTPTPPSPRKDMSRMDEVHSADQPTAAPPTTTEPRTPSRSAVPPQEQDKPKEKVTAPASAPVQALKENVASAPGNEPLSLRTPGTQSEGQQFVRKQDELAQESGRAAGKSEAPAAPSPFATVLSGKPSASARALFYSQGGAPTAEQERRSRAGIAEEKGPAAGTMADAPQKEMKRAERSAGLLGKLEDAKTSTLHPLGLRYSLIMVGPGGIDLEVDPTTPVGKDDTPHLTVEASEDGYLFVFHQDHNNQRTMLFPLSPLSSEHEEARIVHRKRYLISLAVLFASQPSAGELRLVILFSRAPQRDVKSPTSAHKSSQHLLVETIDPSQPGSPQEQAVYVINPAPSPSASILVEVPLTVR